MRWIAVLVFFLSLSAYARPASEESIERLLAVAKTGALLEGELAQFEKRIAQMTLNQFGNSTVDVNTQRAMDGALKRMAQLLRTELSWAKIKPTTIRIYQETLTQDEVDGMLAFYASPAGQAMINKMPALMRKSSEHTMSIVQSLMPRINQIMQDALIEAGQPPKR